MKNLIYLCCIILLATSCQSIKDKPFKSSKLELRQMIQDTETSHSSSGSFFLIAGSYSEQHNEIITVKVFAKVEGRYRMIEMHIEDVRINIDNKISTPFIVIEYWANRKYGDEELISSSYKYKIYVINCPEKYLPEKLLPFEI